MDAGAADTRIRVLRVIARLNVGGPAIHATLLNERLDPARYDARLVAGVEAADEGGYLELHGRQPDRFVRLPDLGPAIDARRDLRAGRALLRMVREFRPHVVHTHTAKAGALGRIAAVLGRVPVVVHTYHGHVLEGYFSPVKTKIFLGVERTLARVTHQLVAVSDQVRRDLLALGIGRPDRFSVVPLGFDLAPFATADRVRGRLRQELGVAAGVPLVGIVARLVPIKAHEVFVAAAARVAARWPDARFVVVGDGECREAIAARIADADLEARTHLLGWRGDLPEIYADLDVVALSSRNEGSPVALIEAMASGRAVAATRAGGVPDVVVHGETGCLVAVDDDQALAAAIDGLLADPERRARLGAAGRARVLTTYGADRLLADVDRLYTRLIAERTGQP